MRDQIQSPDHPHSEPLDIPERAKADERHANDVAEKLFRPATSDRRVPRVEQPPKPEVNTLRESDTLSIRRHRETLKLAFRQCDIVEKILVETAVAATNPEKRKEIAREIVIALQTGRLS